MRLILVFALLALVSEAHAQSPAPWTYYPLGVGDVWEYTIPSTGRALRVYIARDTTANGRPYVVQVRKTFDAAGQPLPPEEYDRTAIRYDTASTRIRNVIPLVPTQEQDFLFVPCPLGALDGEVVPCPAFGGSGRVEVFTGTLTVGDTVVTGVRFKRYITNSGGLVTYAAGVGEVEFESKARPYRRLTYARIGGVAYGTARFPVAAEPAPPAPPPALSMRAYPNPSAGALAVTLTLPAPSAVHVAVYDGLGRRVRSADLGRLGAGPHAASLDLAGLAPGVYLVTLTTEGGRRSTRSLSVLR